MSEYTEKSCLYQIVGPLGVFLLLAACFLLIVNTAYPEPIIVDKNTAPGLETAETVGTGGVFAGISGCVLIVCVLAGLNTIITFKKEVS
jgi:hypothetical protein